MSRLAARYGRSAYYLAALLGLLATPAVAGNMAGWETEDDYGVTPHFAYQVASGDIVHSSCISNGTADFPIKNPLTFKLGIDPKLNTGLGVTGWYDDDGSIAATIFYQTADDGLVTADFKCDYKTGEYKPNGDASRLSDSVYIPSINDGSGMALAELGDSGGYRLFFHDQDMRVNVAEYNENTNWVYMGPVSQKPAVGIGLGAVQPDSGDNYSVVYPFDDNDIVFGQFMKNSKTKWDLEAIPASFSGTVTNLTAASKVKLKSGKPSFSLPSFDKDVAQFGVATNENSQQSIFYIGTDSSLHQVSQVNGAWQVVKQQSSVKWPKADKASGPIAVVSGYDNSNVWVYYQSGGHVVQLYMKDGQWEDYAQPSTGIKNSNPGPGWFNYDDSSSSSDSASPSETSGAASSSTSSGGGNGSSGNSKLGVGATAAIAVGVIAGVGAALFASWLVFYMRRRKSKRRLRVGDGDDHDKPPPPPAEHLKRTVSGHQSNAETLPAYPRVELGDANTGMGAYVEKGGSDVEMHELSAAMRFELPAEDMNATTAADAETKGKTPAAESKTTGKTKRSTAGLAEPSPITPASPVEARASFKGGPRSSGSVKKPPTIVDFDAKSIASGRRKVPS